MLALILNHWRDLVKVLEEFVLCEFDLGRGSDEALVDMQVPPDEALDPPRRIGRELCVSLMSRIEFLDRSHESEIP